MQTDSYLRTNNLCRFYKRGNYEVRALDDVSISVSRREFLSIVGASGSGKTTLLNLLAGLDSPTSGDVEFEGNSLTGMTRRERSAYRAHKVGMVFQSFNLISHYTALQNVEMALYFNDTPHKQRRTLAHATLEYLGLADRVTHKPSDLSGGELQRVALARAIVKKPEILFADEPTGNLDFENTQQIISLLTSLNNEGLTVVLITHNLEMANKYSHRLIRMKYGKLAESDSAPSPGRTIA